MEGTGAGLRGHEPGREGTHAWVVADDIGQPAEDLRRDWSTRRTTWALQTGLPAPTVTTREALAALADPGQARVLDGSCPSQSLWQFPRAPRKR